MALTNYVNVLVHGLFFMWLNPKTKFLELIAPVVDSEKTPKPCRHRLVGGIREHLQEYPGGAIDWTRVGLIGSDVPKLNPDVLQFSMKKAKIDDWNDYEKNSFGRFILPCPVAFYALRHDYWTRSFVYYTSDSKKKGYTSRVGDAIRERCYKDPNTEIGLVTCLQYTYEERLDRKTFPYWRPDINLHCYFEPCKKHSIEAVNADLKKAGEIFKPAGAFDLQMDVDALKNVVTPIGRNPSTPKGYDRNDEYSLTDDPKKPKDICAGADDCTAGILNVSPANCPNFFVGP